MFAEIGIAEIYLAALAAQELQSVLSLTQAPADEKNVAGFGRVAAKGLAEVQRLAGDGEISGTATIRGSFYNFLAKVKSSP